jgi:hypothetical protein
MKLALGWRRGWRRRLCALSTISIVKRRIVELTGDLLGACCNELAGGCEGRGEGLYHCLSIL